MVRTHLSSYFNTDGFRQTNQANRLLCAYVADVVMNSRCFCEQNIPAYVDSLGFIRNAFDTMTFGKLAFRHISTYNQ
ncbi:hypothetical protein D3C74_429930 [compost metagenome]